LADGKGSAKAATESGSVAKTASGIVEQPPVYYVRDKDGRLVPVLGVSLEELRDLLRHKSDNGAGIENSPKFNLQQIAISGEVHGDHADLEAEYKIQTIDAAWVNIPLVSGGAVLSEPAEYHGEGKQALQFDSDTSAYVLRLQGTAGSEHRLKLKFMVPVKATGAQHRLEFAIANSAASHFVLKVPQPTVELQDFSGCAMAEVKPVSKPATGSAELQAWGLGGPLALVWKDGANGKSQSVLEATGQILARIDSRSVQFDALLTVRSFGLPFDKFRVKLPKVAQLTGGAPTGANYTITPAGDGDSQLIDVQLPQKTSGPVDVRLQAEVVYEFNAQNVSLELAGFEVLEAAPHRQWGNIAVAVVGDWQPNWGPLNHVRQIAELPDSLRRADVVAGFEYIGQGASLHARMTPRKTRITVEPEYVFFVEPHQVRLDARLKYTIHGAKTSSLELAIPGWQIDEIGPENVVDSSSSLANAGPTISMPLLHPTAGDVELTLKAHREVPAKASDLEIKLPVPVADVLAPALIAFLPSDNIRLAPTEGEQQGLSRPTVPPRMKLPVREQSPLFFRQEQPQATFTGIMERLPQVVRVGIDSNLEIRQDGIQIQQTLNYHVEHEPLTVLNLDVPKLLASEGHFELMLDDRAIAQLPVNSTDDEQRSHVEVPLTNPRSGAFQLVARYIVPQTRGVTESGQAFTVPLIAPTGIAPEHHRLAVQSETAVRIAASEEAWEVSDEPITSISPPGHPAAHFKALRRATEITLAARPEEPRNLANTVVHRAWIQTWISGSIRQDRTTYQFTTTSEQLQLQLPHEVPPTNVEIRLDHQLLAAPDSNEIKIPVPVTGNDTKHVLELRYQTAITNGQSNSIEAELPKLGSGAWVQRLYWQLVVPGDQHYIGSPSQLTPEFAWNWFGWGWSRQNHWDQADLENWIGAAHQDLLPSATNRYLFSMAGNPERLVAHTAARWQLVLSASALVLVVGLLLLKMKTIRQGAVLFVCGVVLLGLAAWSPDAALLFGQACILGLVLLLLAALMERFVTRRRNRMTRVAAVQESSVFQRSKSPMRVRPMSLAAASTTTGPGELELPQAESTSE